MSRPLRSILAVAALAALGAHPLWAAGDKEKEKDKPKAKAKAGTERKVYNNQDLKKAHASGPVVSAPAPAETPASPATDEAAAQEREWRMRARKLRDALRTAEAKVAGGRVRLAALQDDLSPNNVMDPFRLQTLAAERAKARQEVEAAEKEAAEARKALEDLEDEARKKGVPPGWLREP